MGKNGYHIVQNSPLDVVKSFYEPCLSFSSVFISNNTVNVVLLKYHIRKLLNGQIVHNSILEYLPLHAQSCQVSRILHETHALHYHLTLHGSCCLHLAAFILKLRKYCMTDA